MCRPTNRRLLARFTLAFCLLGATLCGRFLYGIHAENAAMQGMLLPVHELPAKGESVLVVAPHCDDETLGAGGMIAEATRRGARVTVAFITNGDGYPMAVSREYRRLRLHPEDYQRMARLRQGEARSALAHLGVPSDHILFLGYPDGGIAALWNQYWRPNHPYRSRFTGCSVSPYRDGFRPGAVYCGQTLMGDVEELLRRVRPQWLYLPHPGDDHPDHWATHCFTMAALEELRGEPRPVIGPVWPGQGWDSTRVFTYLVHRGDWPVPQGLRRGARLVPPAPLAHLDTQWSSLTLSPTAEREKEAALGSYKSQMAVMKRFLDSFVRRDELFGALPPEQLVGPITAITAFRPPSVEPDIAPHLNVQWRTAISDTTRDTLIRGLEGSGDLVAVETNLSSDRLMLRVTTRRPLSRRLIYTIRLHPLGRGAERAGALTIPFRHRRCDEPRVLADCAGNELEMSVPLSLLGYPSAVMVGADSSLGRVPIDRVCWRLLRLSCQLSVASRQYRQGQEPSDPGPWSLPTSDHRQLATDN
jgi:LmbE family N-acetylglucosaminyl deacetylase